MVRAASNASNYWKRHTYEKTPRCTGDWSVRCRCFCTGTGSGTRPCHRSRHGASRRAAHGCSTRSACREGQGHQGNQSHHDEDCQEKDPQEGRQEEDCPARSLTPTPAAPAGPKPPETPAAAGVLPGGSSEGWHGASVVNSGPGHCMHRHRASQGAPPCVRWRRPFTAFSKRMKSNDSDFCPARTGYRHRKTPPQPAFALGPGPGRTGVRSSYTCRSAGCAADVAATGGVDRGLSPH